MKGRNKPSGSINISHSPRSEPQQQYDDKVGSVRNVVSNPPPAATLHSDERKAVVNRSNTHRPPPRVKQPHVEQHPSPTPNKTTPTLGPAGPSQPTHQQSNPFGMDNMQYYQYKASMFERIRMYGDGQPQLKKYPRIQYLGNAMCCSSVLAKFFTMKVRPYSNLNNVFLEDILFFMADFIDLDILRKEKDKVLPKITKIVNCTFDSNLQSVASIETCYSELMDEVIIFVEHTDEIKKKNKENEKIKELVERDEVQRALDELSTKFKDELQKIVNHVNERFNELNVYFQAVETLQTKIIDIESNIVEISAMQSQVNEEIVKQQGEMEKVILENEKLQSIVSELSSQTTKEALTSPSVSVDVDAKQDTETVNNDGDDPMDMFTKLAGHMGTRLFGPDGMFRVEMEQPPNSNDSNIQDKVKQAHDMIGNLFGFKMGESFTSLSEDGDDERRIEEIEEETEGENDGKEKIDRIEYIEREEIDDQSLKDIINLSSEIEKEKEKRKGKRKAKEDTILDFDVESTFLDTENPYNFFAEELD